MKLKPFNPFCYSRYILNYNGTFVIVEDYQDGELWSDNEIWGSYVFDVKNGKYLNLGGHFLESRYQCALKTLDDYKDCWAPITDYISSHDDETKKYYSEMIEKCESMEPKPNTCDLESPPI